MIKSREVLVYGDPRLKQRAEEVEDPSSCADLAERMHALMEEYNGAGLAAVQIGDFRRVLVWKVGEEQGTLVNPRLELEGETEIGIEGCLSVPGMAGDVRRALRLRATGFDANGKEVDLEAEGLLARILQHEVDHLDGVLFVERAELGSLRPAPMTAVTGI